MPRNDDLDLARGIFGTVLTMAIVYLVVWWLL